MAFQNLPIKRKVMAVIMLTSVVALLLTTTAFMVYDFLSYRQTLVRTLSTTSSIIADESTAALAFKNESDAQQILGALKADSHIVAAALYDELGRLYVRYPPETPISGFPPEPGQTGFHFEPGYVTYFQPVVEKSGWLGTLYLKSDVLALYERLRLYGGIALLVLFGSVLVALAISTALQRRITEPILALAHSARLVSERGDYSVRAPKISGDELGLLTDAFNLMLTRIEEQTVALKESEEQLRLALEASRTGTWVWNVAAGKITADIRSQRLFGRKPVVFRGVYEEFIELLHPEDRDRVKTDVAEALKRKEEYFAEFRVVWPDGTVHYLAARGRGLYDSAGQPVRMSGVVLDVTESKEVERAVRESEARKSAILESAIDCIITMDEEGRIVDFNPAAERVFGYRRDEVIGQPLAEKIIPERLRAAHWQGLARLKDGGPSLILGRRIEMRAMRSDKTEFPVELAISSTALHGRGLFFTAYVRDISERKRAEEALSFLAAIVESSDDAVVGKNLESKVISWNAGAERMFGYSAAEMLGQPITRLLSPERPDEEEAIRDEVKQGETRHFETLRLRRDGLPIDVSLTVSPIKNTRGEIIGVSSIARDITERKRAQAALEKQAAILSEQAQMLELANVMARDLTDQIILWNTGMEKMYGWTKKEALGTIAHQLLHTEFTQSLESIRAAVLAHGHWEGDLVRVRKDGQRILVASQWVLHHDAKGKPAAFLEVNTDITRRKEAEEQVLRMNAELELRVQDRTAELTAANKELEAFTYSVAHDLRAPLRHIDAFSRILHEDYAESLPPDARKYLENIRTGSRNMSGLVDDLLNLARVGRQELRRQPTALGRLVTEVVAELKHETEGRKVEWRIHSLPTVACDPGLVKQVFTNLLSNAVKYTRPRPVASIEVGYVPHDGSGAIFVRDNGVGFNMKYADKLFGVFQRLHRAEEFEGTGVGLATVDRIVRKHGGSVWVEAVEGKGATFFFTVAGLGKGPNTRGA